MATPTNPLNAEHGNQQVKTYTETELNAIIESRLSAVREEEKRKLYPDIERHKTEAQNLKAELESTKSQLEKLNKKAKPTDDQVQEAERLRGELDSLKSQLHQSETNIQQKLDEAINRTLDVANQNFQRQRLADQVAAKKNEVIAAAQGKIIPSLVAGNTVEEVQASAEAAKAEWQRIHDAALAEAQASLKGALPAPVNPGAPASATGNPPNNANIDLSGLRNMNPTEWEQQKASLKQSVYAELGLPMKR